ncbi:hypothetical protein B0J13DRAFT_592358 [Dactylonectria estremocensis]|uniref:Zn(2)-C6 fungal-type domain-containing protein n=1 Tax=Dactylonectria estremocensis TaxID=1079267 RepID=A0A9P9FDT1_9HYPO|nr:hypothetical protein B0J13DRAFT_592358 [Dactylonectria estremocensis]
MGCKTSLEPCEAQLATIASQLRIQSILSPADPEVDEPPTVSSSHSTPKRKFEEALTTSEAPVALRRTESLDEPSPRQEGPATELSRGHAEEQRSSVPLGAREGKKPMKMRPPMRSSIACMRCRRSKIKCDNDGGNSPCDTCIKGGHQCQYPDSIPPPAKRSDPPNSIRQEKEGTHERKRARKVDEYAGLDNEKSAAYAEEVLSYPFLTTNLWDQLLGIYRLHFATELSFLHLPTLKEKMSRRKRAEHEPSTELNLYVAHLSSTPGGGSRPRTSQSKADPYAASEFFANVLATALGPLKTAITVATVERVQAFLMLGLFEWSQRSPSSGPGAWMYIGIAIRMAQMLKLGFDDQVARGRDGSSQGASSFQRGSRSSSDIGIVREIRRRTMFSCLILDRMMTCGDERISMIRPDTIRIQLPCTEMAFDLALDVNTGFLNLEGDVMNQHLNDDSVLSRFIQLVEIWTEISSYSSRGGRSRDQLPPWEQQSTFWTLRERLSRFLLNLPDTFTFSRRNYYRHDNHQATNMYLSLHLLVSVCQIVLHREYLPFLPLRCSKPEGPFIPTLTAPHETPDGFWEEIAEPFFEAARNVVDLVDICRDKLPLSSLALFSVWLAGFVGVYARNFPFMDTRHQMVSQDDMDELDDDSDVFMGLTTALAYHSLLKMTSSSQAAHIYLKYLEETDRYYTQAGSDRSGGSTADRASPMSLDTYQEVPRLENRVASRTANAPNRSMLVLPGVEPESLLMSRPDFSLDQLSVLESQRIGRMLNDLEEFSGAGSLGGIPFEGP